MPQTTVLINNPLTAAPPGPAEPFLPHKGFTPGAELVFTRTATDRRFELDEIKATGAQIVRLDCTPGGQNQIDAAVADAEARNLKMYMVLWGTTGPTSAGTFGTDQSNKWNSHPLVVGMEICNEPDLNGWTASGYGSFANTVANQIHTAHPGRYAIVPGALWKGNDGQAIRTFTDALISSGALTHAAAISFHGYDLPTNQPTANWNIWSQVFPIAGGAWNGQTMREKLNAGGFSALPIICSETGSGKADQLTQANEITVFMDETRVPSIFIYRMMRDGAFAEDALLNSDRTRRLAWTRYQQET